MRSRLTKTIILIVFVVFLGIKNVRAFTCTYSRNVNGEDQTYIIDLDTKTVTYETFRVPMAKPTSTTITGASFTFTECPVSINIRTEEIGSIPGRLPGVNSNSLGNITATIIEDAGSGGDYTLKVTNQYSNNVSPLKPGEEGPVTCGTIKNIPANIPKVTKIIYLILQVLVPIALIIFGMLDLVKGVMDQKEDEIKKGQQTFVKRLIAATLVFFVFAIVKMVASFLQDSTTVTDCLNCFISGECNGAEGSTTESEEK